MRLIILLLLIFAAQSQYTVISQDIGSTYVKLGLKYTGQSDFYVKPKSKVVKELVFLFKAHTYSDFSFKIYDPNQSRFEVPQGGIFPIDTQTNFSFPLSFASYKINFTKNHFGFIITRKETDAIIFDSSIVEIEFSQYYLQFGTVLDSKTLFGYSERNAPHFKLTPGTWAMFNAENGYDIDQGVPLKGKQTYGYYPAYMLRERSGHHHIGYLRTTNALDVEIQSFSNSSYMQIFRVIGGIIDFRFIVGQKNPQELLTKFHGFIGNSLIPPFWSLGYHQCRWGYKNITVLETVISKFKENNIPLDTIWTDIDYMDEHKSLTVNTELFPLDRLRALLNDHQYILLSQPYIRMVGFPQEEGKRQNVYIKDASGADLVGSDWTGPIHFPDFFHPNATQYWKDMMQYLYDQVPFSGLGLQMNEPYNMCDGLCTSPTTPAVIDYSKDIPYTPGGGNIERQTIALNSTHYGNMLQANVHPLYGLMHTYHTFQFLNKIRRPFLLSVSTTFGSNRFGFHWTGDNYANFTFLKNSITANFMFGMWGVQMIGSDICGFGGNTTVQICSRYFQLGSLYPFARNNNEIDAIDQQPYALGPVVLQSSRKNLKLRYSLLKLYYREFLIRKGVGTIFRPLYFQFYDDENVLSDNILETQFLIGNSLMSAPIIEQGKTSRTVYFPGEQWFNFHTGQYHAAKSLGLIENSLTDLVPLFLRSGSLVFRQDVENITKSRDLDGRFILVAGFKLKTSNSTTVTYISKGGLLSASDYNNEDDIQKCIAEDCDYGIQAVLIINKISREKQLTLNYQFNGKSVKNAQQISELVIYTEDEVARFTPIEAVDIYGSGSKTITFK